MKKLLAITLSVCMMICALSISAFAASDPYDDVDAAIAAIGLKSLGANVIQDSVYGSTGFATEESFNLFDDDVTTKFCTGTFPLYAIWQMDKAYSIGGVIMATANDNSSQIGRNPDNWVLYGCTTDSDNDADWVELAKGTGDDLEDTDYTYYTVKFDAATPAYEWFKFEVDTAVNTQCFQMSELILCEAAEAPAAPVEEAPAPAEEAPAVEETPVEKGDVEETAPATEAPVVDTPAPTTAPKTSDYAIVILSAAAAIALAAIVVLKKKAIR